MCDQFQLELRLAQEPYKVPENIIPIFKEFGRKDMGLIPAANEIEKLHDLTDLTYQLKCMLLWAYNKDLHEPF